VTSAAGRRELLVAGALLVGVLGLKLPTLGVPYHWDEMTAYVAPARWLAGESLWRGLPGLHPPEQFFGHPTGLYLLMAVVYRALGHSIEVSHAVAVTFAFLGVWCTYRLGSDLGGASTGLLAAVFLLFTPVYFAQAGMLLADLPVASCGALCLHCFLRDRRIPYLVCGFALVALKETGAAVPFAIAIWLLGRERHVPGGVRKAALYGSPLALTIAFFVAQRLSSGRFVANPFFAQRPSVHGDPQQILAGLVQVCGWVLGAQQRWALTLIVVAAVAVRGWRAVWRREFGLFALVGSCFVVAFSFLYVLPRYLLPTFPLLCVVAATALSGLVRATRWRVVVGCAVTALSVVGLFGADDAPDSFSEDMQYVDVVRTHQEAARYLAERHPGARVHALWPLSRAFRDPAMGYVTEPLALVDDRATADVVVLTPQGSSRNLELASWVERSGLRLERRVERRGKRVDIYVRGSLASGDHGLSP